MDWTSPDEVFAHIFEPTTESSNDAEVRDLFELFETDRPETVTTATVSVLFTVLLYVQRNFKFLALFFLFLSFFLYIENRVWLSMATLHLDVVLFAIDQLPLAVRVRNSLEDEVNWIRRETSLLRAIVRDARRITALAEQIKEKGHQLWHDSDPRFSAVMATIGLTEAEIAWVVEAEHLIDDANSVFVRYSERGGNEITKNHFITLEQLRQFLSKTGQHSVQICRSLETTWSAIRKLLDRPVEEHHNSWVQFKLRASAAKSASSCKRLLHDKLKPAMKLLEHHLSSFDFYFIKLQVDLLYPFLEQIEEIKLESAVGDYWVMEIEEIIGIILGAIEAFKRMDYTFGRYPIIRTWNAWQLEKEMKHVYVYFSDLFTSKERHGFDFIVRDSSTSTRHSLHRTIDDTVNSWIIPNIKNSLNHEVAGEAYFKLKSLFKQLKELYDMEEKSESKKYQTAATLEAVQIIAKIAEKSIETFRNDSFQDGIRKARERLSKETDNIQYFLHLLKRSKAAYKLELRDESSSVVGFEEDIHQVVSQLIANDSRAVVSIVGMEGVGTTTLGKKIYSHRAVLDHFNVLEWATLPLQQPNDHSFLIHVAQQVMKQPLPYNICQNIEHLKEMWIQKVRGRRYLLVLDNVQTEEAWDTLKVIFMHRSSGSRILLTTSNEEVGSKADQTGTPHQLRLRTKEESLRLFKQLVHISPEEETTAKEIVDRCLGLPQAIQHVGYLTLWKDMSVPKMVMHLKRKNDRQPLVETFKMANKELPVHLKKCLYYFGLFPWDFEIPTRRVVALWVAEGLVHRKRDGKETPEDIANKYLSELIAHNIIQVVKRKPSGKVKTCCLPIAMREFWLSKLQQQGVSSVVRVADQFGGNGYRFKFFDGNSSTEQQNLQMCRDLHSFLSFDPREGDEPGKDISDFLRRGIASGCFLRMQVLDLERVFRPKLPKEIGKLKKVRYLGLRWTYLESIPSSVGDLELLETLDVKHTDLRDLPESVWKLPRLRHLYLNKSNRSNFILHQSGSSLKNLETLWSIYVDASNPPKDFLYKLINVRKLGLSMQSSVDVHVQKAWWEDQIVKMEHLRCLRLRSTGEMGEPHDLFLKLSGLDNLSNLDLFGKLKDPWVLAGLPKNLTELTLSASNLHDDPMPKLEKLTSLKLLCLYSKSCERSRMVCSSGGFPNLLVLRIWKLTSLIELQVNEDSLQNLRELDIRSCDKLQIPDGLKNLKALLELKLTNMPLEFTEYIKRDTRNIWGDATSSPSIIVSSYN